MLILGEGLDGLRVGEVAKRVGVTLPATSRLLRRLEQRSLVSLVPAEHDQRAARATLAGAGRTVRGATIEYRRLALREIASAVSAPDAAAARPAVDAIADGLGHFA